MSSQINYYLDADIIIKGNLLVKGTLIYAKSSPDFETIVSSSDLRALSDFATNGVCEGNITIENDLILKCYGEGPAGSEESPTLTVEGDNIITNIEHRDTA